MATKAPFRKKTQAERKVQVDEVVKRIEAGVSALVTSEDWIDYLRCASRFHRYSMRNQILIAIQKPDAVRVAGFGGWLKLNRCVRKGEKGIQIFAPVPYRKTEILDDGTEKDVRGMFFRIGYVFDVSQTEVIPGKEDKYKEHPGIGGVVGTEETAKEVVLRLADFAISRGWSVNTVPAKKMGTANGSFDGRVISIKDTLPMPHHAKTLAHEIAHAVLHFTDGIMNDAGRNTAQAEIEAESTACVVMEACGIDSGGYTFGYVAGWSGGDTEKVKAALGSIQVASKEILDFVLDDSNEQNQEEAA